MPFAFLLCFFFLQSPVPSADLSPDARLFLKINGFRSPFLNGASRVLSDVAILPGLIYVYSGGYGYFRDEPEALRFGVTGVAVSSAVVVANQAIKAVVKRERPIFAVPGAQGAYAHGLTVHLIPSEQYSFPSQSASLSMSTAMVYGYAFPGWEPWLYSLAILNGWSRIYRGAHYPGDVLAGEALGLGVTWGVLRLLRNADPDYDIRKNPPRIPLIRAARTF